MKPEITKINQTKENLVATLRALLGDDSLAVEFDAEVKNNFFAWDQNLVKDKWGDRGILLPELDSNPPDKVGGPARGRGGFCPELRINSTQKTPQPLAGSPPLSGGFDRGFCAAADLSACYLLFHDSKLGTEKNYNPEDQRFFDEFEKIRVIACVKNSYRGVVKNILAKVEDDIFSGSTSLSLILLKEIFAGNILPKTSQCVDDLEQNLNKKIVTEIKNLTKIVEDQSAFESSVARILEMLKEEKDSQEKEDFEKNSSTQNEKKENDLNSFGQENVESEAQENFAPNDVEEGEKEIEKQEKISDLREDDQKGKVTVKLDAPSDQQDRIEFKNAYKIYTSKFDEVIFPQKLVSKNELELLRDQLDLKMNKLDSISKKMTLKLKRKLLSKRNSFLELDASRGILDRKKLTRLVVDPFVEDIWVSSKNHQYQDTCLTILLDNSGSMRGNPIVMSAMACEIIAGILEKFSVKTEIIGFTTADWKGGKARKLWESAGRPKNPGRLNELRHVIYKHFNQKFKKAKTNLGLMLKEGLLKENIDSEALLFARSRLMQQSEKRKILLVISDGTPVDDSTNSTNDSDILTDHLHHVINKIEKSNRGQIEIVGIGIGHTTEEFYRNSITIRSLEELGDVMIEKIVALL